ncbi:unnamed protein product, partial [marine sediment metagenome]
MSQTETENPFAPRPDLKVWLNGELVPVGCPTF